MLLVRGPLPDFYACKLGDVGACWDNVVVGRLLIFLTMIGYSGSTSLRESRTSFRGPDKVISHV